MSRLSQMREKARGMSPRDMAGEAWLRARRSIARTLSRATDRPDSVYVSGTQLRQSLRGQSIAEVAQQIKSGTDPRFIPGLADVEATASAIRQLFPDAPEEARRTADAILAHRITLFETEFDLGPEIDWHRDPATGAAWPLMHFTRVPLRLRRGSDVRVVWELSRLQQLTALGRAYALTSDEKYAEEFLLQIASWYEANPPRFGVNWVVAMEAAIRAVNILAALEMFRPSELLTEDAVELILKMLLAHGKFIRANLEYSHRTPSNHYLSDLIGLFVIGMAIPEFRQSEEWVSFSASELLKEFERQVLEDGVSYEGSTGYHRLVLEIFSLFFALCRAGGVELPGRHWERLEKMFRFVRHYLKPDGAAPIIGDSDDGRILKFKSRPAYDHSYLMSLACVLLENEEFKQSGRIDEEAIWWFGHHGLDAFESLPVNDRLPESQDFESAQIFIQRQGPLYAIIDCGDHGANGRGSHAHADALSLEVFAFDRTFLRDPGTFVYSANERWRNLFRSTAYHNTVRVDGLDTSRITPGHLFALGPNVKPHVNYWRSDAERDVLDAEHDGYQIVGGAVTHRRIVLFDKHEEYWVVEDWFEGEGRHLLEFFFNFDAGLKVTIEDGRATAHSEAARFAVIPRPTIGLEPEVARRWVSPSYGVRLPASGIIYRLETGMPFRHKFLLVPYRLDDGAKLEKILAGQRPEDGTGDRSRPGTDDDPRLL